MSISVRKVRRPTLAMMMAGLSVSVEVGSPSPEDSSSHLVRRTRFLTLYDVWCESVHRWIRALGGPEGDRDDIAQEVFLVASRRLHAFDGSNPAAWLYRITQRQVRDFRRRTWIKRIFTREHTDAVDALPDDDGFGPARALERKQNQRILYSLLSRMNVERRAAFVLFEIDGLPGEEIAKIQGVAVNTIWKRLHVARKELLALVARYGRGYDPTAPLGGRRGKAPRT
jgi:RNA polymerase sigma-70 factor, ECF subfamily